MFVRGIVAVGTVAGVAAFTGAAEAKDLSGRIGVGYENTLIGDATGGTLGGISARYYVNQQILLGGQLGYTSFDPDEEEADSISSFGVGINGGYVFVEEPNLNVYGGAGLKFGSVSASDPATGETESKSALGLDLGIGMEFFFVGLPNLGFTAAYGLSYASVSDVGSAIELGANGDFATMGIRYYFGGPTGPAGP